MKDFKSSNSMSMESAANRRTPSGRAAFIPGAALLILMLSFGIAGGSKSKPNGGFGQNSASQNASVQNTAIPTPTSMAVTVDQPELTKKRICPRPGQENCPHPELQRRDFWSLFRVPPQIDVKRRRED